MKYTSKTRVTVNGKTKQLGSFCKDYNLSVKAVLHRLNTLKWTILEALQISTIKTPFQ